jgi:hypothetical protein
MVTCIYLLNLGVMNNKIETFNIYTMVANEHEGEEEESNEQPKEDELGIEKSAATNVHIHTIKVQIKVEECNASNKLKGKQFDYVDMPYNLGEVD